MKTLRRFLAVLTIATAAFVWTGCDEEDDPTLVAAPMAGRSWESMSAFFSTNSTTGIVNNGF